LKLARDAADRAGRVAVQYFESRVGSVDKIDKSPVTIADQACEELITRMIHQAFPDDGILGEEGARTVSSSGRRWIIDPIDGTRDFVRRTPFWAIQIALEVMGQIVLGIIHLPLLDGMFHALKGSGCFWNGQRLRASGISSLDRAIVLISGFKDAWSVYHPGRIRYLTENCWTVRAYSGCYDVTMIARGHADLWISGSGMEWDYAPARIIAEECGARFMTLDGNDRIDQNHCIICAPGLEAEVRRVLQMPPGS